METGELTFIGFCSLAAINALFFAVYAWFRREKNLYTASLLSLFMVIIAYRIIQMLLHDLQEDFNIGLDTRSVFFFIPVFPLIGPFLYLYIKSVSGPDSKFRTDHLFHLVPFLLVLILNLLNRDKFLKPAFEQKYYMAYCIEVSVILIQFLAYIIISFIYARKLVRKEYNENNSRFDADAGLKRNIVIVVSVIWFIYALYCVQIYFRTYLSSMVIEALYYSVLSYWILYIELRTRKITSLNTGPGRYKSSSLAAEDAGRFKIMILDHMNTNALYNDHNITLGKFSKGVSLTPHIVSQVINEQLSCNFNDFVNSYRVEEAKKMLKDPGKKNFTIASIAYDCGFNTLSAFNTAFKKFTGSTPSQYRSMEQ